MYVASRFNPLSGEAGSKTKINDHQSYKAATLPLRQGKGVIVAEFSL